MNEISETNYTCDCHFTIIYQCADWGAEHVIFSFSTDDRVENEYEAHELLIQGNDLSFEYLVNGEVKERGFDFSNAMKEVSNQKMLEVLTK
jgi:hypothetical protein